MQKTGVRPTSAAKLSAVRSKTPSVPVQKLLIEHQPAREVFWNNLRALFWKEKQPKLRLTSWPGTFWPDVFVQRRPPWEGLARSAMFHLLVIGTLWAASEIWPHRAQFEPNPSFSAQDVVYYDASEYLPALNTGRANKVSARKGDPVLARQPIVSVPPESDNRSQTIIAPPKVRLDHRVPLPNVVAWAETIPAVPLSATTRSVPEWKIPVLPEPIVAPAPEVILSGIARMPGIPVSVVAPPPDVIVALKRDSGTLNIARVNVVQPAPRLAMAEQRVVTRSQAALGASEIVPPAPSTLGASTSSGGGRLISLSIRPAAPSERVSPPAGSRRGTFAAALEGREVAAGTPQSEIGKGNSSESPGSSLKDVPRGLQVGASKITGDSRLMADAHAPPVSGVRSAVGAQLSDNPTALERQIFGGKRSYSMTLNMPNLNSAGGSWVIHFAELKEGFEGNLSAPVAIQKVDPGYPMELMRHNIAGTVTLYAVIGTDGSVGGVRVLHGVDDRLDGYAKSALARWRFNPATRNGTAVSLEAVVLIPFHPARRNSNF